MHFLSRIVFSFLGRTLAAHSLEQDIVFARRCALGLVNLTPQDPQINSVLPLRGFVRWSFIMLNKNKWIQKAIKKENKGKLREALGAKAGKPIPAKKLEAAAKKPGIIGKRARLAETLKGLK